MKIILSLYRTENVTPVFDEVCIYWFNIGPYDVNSMLIYHLTVGGGDNINYHYLHSERYITGGIFEICSRFDKLLNRDS